jgi:hypothetical protein
MYVLPCFLFLLLVNDNHCASCAPVKEKDFDQAGAQSDFFFLQQQRDDEKQQSDVEGVHRENDGEKTSKNSHLLSLVLLYPPRKKCGTMSSGEEKELKQR